MIKHSPPHSFLGSSVPWMIMHAVAPNTWCFAPMRFLLSFLPCFVRNAFLPLRVRSAPAAAAAATPVLQDSFFTFLRLYHATLVLFHLLLLTSSIFSLENLLSVCLSVLLCLCYSVFFSLGMSDSSSLQFALDQLGSRARSCCLAGSICLMN